MKHFSIQGTAQLPLAQGRRRRSLLYTSFFKRLVDIIVVIAVVPLLLPIVAVLWVLIKRDGGPGFYGHSRVGRNGASFKCWKLRTMGVNSAEALAAHLAANPDAAQAWAESRKLRDDPRITRIGNILRKTSLDELPQFWNVLIGEMSLVGPRPVVEDELTFYAGHEDAYLSMRPGITGIWQVSGRNDVSYERRVRFDAEYQETVSLTKDIEILAKTMGVVIGRTGS